MWSLKEIIFGLFGPAEKRADTTNRDQDGRGLNERFMRALGGEFDDSLRPLLDNFLANLIDPVTALARFVPYLENQMGVNYVVSDDLAVRRKLIAWAPRITRIKGTKRSYEILLKLMGFLTVNIIEYWVESGFDSPLTLDDEDRRYDGGCAGCSEYSLELTGTLALTPELRAWILSVIAFCEPINARLRSIIINGYPVSLNTILIQINEAGDLEYDNSGAPEITLKLLPNGDLQIRGFNSSRYRISPQGDLQFY